MFENVEEPRGIIVCLNSLLILAKSLLLVEGIAPITRVRMLFQHPFYMASKTRLHRLTLCSRLLWRSVLGLRWAAPRFRFEGLTIDHGKSRYSDVPKVWKEARGASIGNDEVWSGCPHCVPTCCITDCHCSFFVLFLIGFVKISW